MSAVYDHALKMIALKAAHKIGVRLREGVYVAVSGPAFETPATIAMLKTLGADLVGMSTIPEVTAARQMNARVLGLSLITNYAAGRTKRPLTHETHLKTAKTVEKKFIKLMEEIITRIN